MKIAVVAWGSLVSNPRELKAQAFAPTGPLLPIEFCRVSGDGRLTLVIDERFGAVCTTHAAASAFDSLDAAIDNLRLREGMPSGRGVGFIDLASGERSPAARQRHPDAVETIAAWAEGAGYDAAVWTALASNFSESGEPFSVTAALAYLERLEEEDAAKFALALAYIRAAPIETDTPVRHGVARRWPTQP